MPDNPSSTIVADPIMKELMAKACVHLVAAQEYIMVNEEKAYRCAMEWRRRIEKRNQWTTPLVLLLPLVFQFATTAAFKDALGIPKETWQAFLLFCILGGGVWLVVSVVQALRIGEASIEKFIDDLKKGATRLPVNLPTLPAQTGETPDTVADVSGRK